MQIFVFLLLIMCGLASKAEVVRVAMPPGVAELAHTKFLFEKIYANLGMKIAWIDVPYLRSRSLLVRGQADADLVRISDAMGAESIRVDFPLCFIDLFVYSRKGAIKYPVSIEELKVKSVVVRRGSAVAILMGDKKNIVNAQNTEQMIQFFNTKRVEFIVTVGVLDEALIDSERFLLKRLPMYHFVGKKLKNKVLGLKMELERQIKAKDQEIIEKEVKSGFSREY